MQKVLWYILLYVLYEVSADDDSATPASELSPTAEAAPNPVGQTTAATSTTKKGGLVEGTNGGGLAVTAPGPTMLYNISTTAKNKKAEKCSGWCMKDRPKSRSGNINVKTNVTADTLLIEKFAIVRNAVEKMSHFPVKVGTTIYADKSQFQDFRKSRSRSQLLQKNVLNVPSMIFYPYTRRMLVKAIADSGQLFIPEKNAPSVMQRAQPLEPNELRPFLRNDAWIFDNSYFQKNPLLHAKGNKRSRSRKVKGMSFRELYNKGGTPNKDNDEDMVWNDEDRREAPMQLKTTDINEFILTYNKGRSKKKNKAKPVDDMLGKINEDTVMENSQNDLENIVGGMKIHHKDAGTFIIGKTGGARARLIRWLKSKGKGRSKNMSYKKGKGVVLLGGSRTKAINRLFKSMISSYQYGNEQLRYKKF